MAGACNKPPTTCQYRYCRNKEAKHCATVTKFQLKNIKIYNNVTHVQENASIKCFAAATAVITLREATVPLRAVYILEMQTKRKGGVFQKRHTKFGQ